MVLGAYHPEVSGGGVQCRQLVRALTDRVRFTILTTCSDPGLPTVAEVDGVPVHRVSVNVARFGSKVSASWRLASAFVRLGQRCDLVHFHGFSQKSLLLIAFAMLFRRKFVIKLSLVGDDDPVSVRARGRVGFWFYSRAGLFFGVSPRLQQLYASSGLPREKFRLIPNGVDPERFRPGDEGERRALRRELGLPAELPLILFVGLFSRKKRPGVLFEAWMRIRESGVSATGLVFVGATRAPSYDVDPELGAKIRARVQDLGLEKSVAFVEATHEPEKYYRAADLFVLPSDREGLPNALLEAMASGLPCITSRLSGITDLVIHDGTNGLLVPPGDAAALERALRFLLENPLRARELGQRARETAREHFSIALTASRCREAYGELIDPSLPSRGGGALDR